MFSFWKQLNFSVLRHLFLHIITYNKFCYISSEIPKHGLNYTKNYPERVSALTFIVLGFSFFFCFTFPALDISSFVNFTSLPPHTFHVPIFIYLAAHTFLVMDSSLLPFCISISLFGFSLPLSFLFLLPLSLSFCFP